MNLFPYAKSAAVLCCAFLLSLLSCTVTKEVFVAENNRTYNFAPEVRVVINATQSVDSAKPVLLILYALPNGNTIEMTAGRHMTENLDWHYDIQHIAAQTRFLREALPHRTVVVAYLEAAQRSWPAWRKKQQYQDGDIARILNFVRFETGNPDEIILAGHSGGGSFITGVLNAYDSIPRTILRIAYLDANYSYDDSLHHGSKLLRWLQADTNHCLSVIAYDDREIVFNGKKVIGPTGGTFRATKRMIQRFAQETDLSERMDSTILQYSAFNNRARFILHTNPDTLILHTVLVERNGFIHSVLFNTPHEERNYRFFGDRSYVQYISEQ